MVAGLQAIQIGRQNHDCVHQCTKSLLAVTNVTAINLLAYRDHFFNHQGGAL